MKRCYKCKQIKELTEFHKNKNRYDGRVSTCKLCMKVYYKKHFTRIAKCKHDAYYANPDIVRNQQLKLKFKITLSELKDIQAIQNNKCQICESQFSKRNPPVVDHDHNCCPNKDRSCGKCIRSLICRNCNTGLGHFKDKPELLRTAADYIEIHKNLLTIERDCGIVDSELESKK